MSLQRSLTGTFLALGFGLALLGSASAQSDARGMRGGNFGGSRGGSIGADMGRGGWDSQQDRYRVSEEVRQFFSGNSTLKVKQLLSLNEHRGMELKKLILVAETRGGNGTAELVINGRTESFPERVGTQIENVDLVPRSSGLVIGRDINSLQIDLKGQFYVEKVIAVLEEPSTRPGPAPAPGSVARKYISQTFRGFETLHLRQLMNLDQDFRGMNIAKIVVTGESVYGSSQARVLVNGSQVGRTEAFSRFRRDLEFALPNSSDTLGNEIRTLELDLQGEIYIESIEVHFERRSTRPTPGPAPRPSDELTRAVRMPLKGAHALNLIDVMSATANDGRREVSRVDITVSGANDRAALALCVNTVRGQVCDTEEDLSFGRRTSITLDARGRTALKDLILMSKGTLTLERITVHFQ